MTPGGGEVWLFDLGMAEKVRPALVISVAFGDADRALVTSPAHFHAEYGEYEALVEIETLASNGQPCIARN